MTVDRIFDILPIGWTKTKIGTIASVKNGPFGSVLHADDYKIAGIPIITVEHLVNGRIKHANLPYVGMEDYERLGAYRLADGDLVISRVGSVDRVALVTSREDGWLFSGRTLRIRLRAGDPHYFNLLFQSEPMKRQLRILAVGQTMPSLNSKLMDSVLVAQPPLDEQQAISGSLEDADLFINALKLMIEKKRNVREGVAQELLTGKTKLFGNIGVWKRMELQDVLQFCNTTIPVESIDARHYVGTENMIKDSGGVIDNNKLLGYSKVREYLPRDILVSNIRPYLKKIWFATHGGGCSNDVLVLRSMDEKRYDPAFCFLLLSRNDFFIYATNNSSGTKMPRGDKEAIKRYLVKMPESIDEQKAIVDVLVAMDREIADLEYKLEKYKQIRQGMMRELLTGHIRLVQE